MKKNSEPVLNPGVRSLCRIFVSALFVFFVCSLSGKAAQITLLEPADGARLDVRSPAVRKFLEHFDARGVRPPRPPMTKDELAAKEKQDKAYAEGKGKAWKDRYNYYIDNDWTAALMKEYDAEGATYFPLRWTLAGDVDTLVLEFSETPDFRTKLTQPVKKVKHGKKSVLPEGAAPAMLKLGVRYFWRAVATDASGAVCVSDVRSFTTENEPPRMLKTKVVGNFRDFGGGTNALGQAVRQGLLFRGTASHPAATEAELKNFFVDQLGIKTEIDLRETDEFAERAKKWGEKDLKTIGITHVFYSMYPYHVYHAHTKPAITNVIARLADPSTYPAYINCAVGSDRTGTISFIVGAILGRDDKYLIDDYELSSFNSPYTRRYRYSRKMAGMLNSFSKKREDGTVMPYRESVVRFLEDVLKVPHAQIEAIREIMLER